MSKKKIFAAIMSMIFFATTFTGCSSGERVAGGAGGGVTIIIILEILDHFTSIASNTGALFKSNSDNPAPNVQSEIPQKTEVVEKNELPEKIETQNNPVETEEKIIEKPNQNKNSIPPKTENKNSSAEPNITYERFTDKKCGFSVEYPADGDDPNLIVENPPEQANFPDGNAFDYSLQFDHSVVITGMNFAYIEDTDNLDYVAKNLVDSIRSFNKEDMKIKVEKLGKQTFLLSWINPDRKEDYIQKSFFGKNHYGGKEHHYIRYVYNFSTPESEKKVAKHMIDSFRSGFEE